MKFSDRTRATLVGTLILLAYSMLTYTITEIRYLGVFTDIISGISVISIPLLLFPLFNVDNCRGYNYAYVVSRFIEGALMIIGAFLILEPSKENHRDVIYAEIHIWFFISGAFFLYILFYFTKTIPTFISIWGLIATILLLVSTILQLFIKESLFLQSLVLPMVLNEIFLAIWCLDPLLMGQKDQISLEDSKV